MNEQIVNLPGAFIPMAEARGLQAQSLVKILSGIGCAEIIDQYIDPAGVLHHIVDHSNKRFRSFRIVEYALYSAPFCVQLVRDSLCLLHAAGRHVNNRPFFCAGFHTSKSDTPGRCRDYNNFLL